jgi:uncharacterized membrane protein
MIGLETLYVLTGTMFAAFAASHARHRAWRSAGFWGAFALLLLAGSWLSDLASGALVLGMVALAAIGLQPAKEAPSSSVARTVSANRLGNRLFLPALAIPAITLAGTLFLPLVKIHGAPLADPRQTTLVALAAAAMISLGIALPLLRASPATAAQEGRRLMDAVGWAALLPQMLAGLGGIFAAAGVGKVVAGLATSHIPMTLPSSAVLVYCLGMALFTMIMGNAFAAFPVMTAGIGLPLIVGKFGGDPAVMSALGMLSGFCGTLLTPMAANFNIVPAAVLELHDRNAVIKVQAPTAIVLFLANTCLMAVFVYHR